MWAVWRPAGPCKTLCGDGLGDDRNNQVSNAVGNISGERWEAGERERRGRDRKGRRRETRGVVEDLHDNLRGVGPLNTLVGNWSTGKGRKCRRE